MEIVFSDRVEMAHAQSLWPNKFWSLIGRFFA
jgi:hypothetical protein